MSEVTEQPAAPESTSAPQTPVDPPSLFGDVTAETPETPEIEVVQEIEASPEGLTQEELEEIEYEGKKAKVPKEFKDAFLRQQDYTRKTQEVAEARRTAEMQYAEYQRTAQLRDATFAEQALMAANHQRLQQFQQLDWDAITKADPVQAMTLERQMRDLQAQNQQFAQSIAQKQQQMAFGEQQATAKRIEEGRQQLAREIKGWSPEVAGKCLQVAKSFGFRDEELANVSDPRTVKILHELLTLRQTVAKQSVKPAPAPLPKPVTKVSGAGATNTKALSDLSTEEWAAKRQERRNQPRRF